MGHGFTWVGLIPGVSERGLGHVLTSAAVFVLLLILGILFYRRTRHTEDALLPTPHIGLRSIFGAINDMLIGLCQNIIGPGGEKYLPLVGTIFYYILGCNLLGLLPGVLPPTDNLFTNLACAAVVFLATHYYGLKSGGIGYLRHFLAPVSGLFGILLSFLFLPIELTSHLFRPLSLSLRLFGNMTGDHTVLEIFSRLVPIGVPVIFYGLGLVVCVLQAFIFSLLTMVYIAGAVEHESH